MKIVRIRNFAIALSSFAMGGAFASAADAAPDPQKLLRESAKAHGGADRWMAAPAVRLRFVMHLTNLPAGEGRSWSDSWRYYETVVDPDTSRAYVDVPHENRPGAEAGFDGKKLWRAEYSFDPKFQDGPLMLSWYHYAMVALPFIAAPEGAGLEYLGREQLPNAEGEFDVVRIDYAPLGQGGAMTVYIDPETHLIRAWKQQAMFPPLPGEPIPGAPTPPGAVLRVVDHYQTAGGFTLPRAYVSYNPAMEPGGFHMVLEAEILDAFDSDAATAPEGAKISYEKP